MKNRVLLLRLDAIGDFVLFTSILPYLRKKFGDDFLSLVVNPIVEPLAEGCPYVDEVWSLDERRYNNDINYKKEVITKLDGEFDIAINAKYTRTAFSDNIVARTHAPVKIGFECIDKDGQETRRNKEQILYTALVRSQQEWMFEIERNIQLLYALGVQVEKRNLMPVFWIQANNKMIVSNLVDGILKDNNHLAVICPSAGFDTKLWSADAFAAVADQLIKKYQMNVIFTGSEKDIQCSAKIMELMKQKAYDLTGALTLPQFVELIKRANFFVGIDTAGFHIAWALGIPTIGIFGGGHFGRFTPTLPNVRIVNVPMDCYNCYWHCIYDEVKCITSITPGMVIEKIDEVLKVEKVT